MNALNAFFGTEVNDESVLVSHPEHVVERPEDFFGGTHHEVGRWLVDNIGNDKHCWLSATDRASHLFFTDPADAQRFRDYLARRG